MYWHVREGSTQTRGHFSSLPGKREVRQARTLQGRVPSTNGGSVGTRQGQGPKEGGLRKALAGHRSATHTPVTPAQRVASTRGCRMWTGSGGQSCPGTHLLEAPWRVPPPMSLSPSQCPPNGADTGAATFVCCRCELSKSSPASASGSSPAKWGIGGLTPLALGALGSTCV